MCAHRATKPDHTAPRVVRLSQITEDAENDRLFGTDNTRGREIPDGAQSELHVADAVEIRARRLQVLENSRVQRAAGVLFQVEVGVVRRVACRESTYARERAGQGG